MEPYRTERTVKGMKSRNNKRIILVVGASLLVVAALLVVFNLIPGFMGYNSGKKNKEETENKAPQDKTVTVERGKVRLACDDGLGNMDVAKNSDNYYLALNVFDRLVEIGEKDDGTPEIEPSLAKEWSVSPDGRSYSFTLRDDVCFSDGTPLTAADVKFSLTRLLTVPDSEQTAYADMIVGAEDLMEGKAKELSGISVIDDTHLKISLNEPFPSYISMLGSPACSILSEKTVSAAGDSYGSSIESIVGSGPYMITDNNENVCVLEQNPLYWGEEPSVKKAEMRVMVHSMMNREFLNKNLDMLDMDFMNREAKDYYLGNDEYKDRVIAKDNVEVISLMLNTAMSPLDNVKVRQAVQYAIDRERIIEEVCGGYGVTVDGIFPKGLIGYTEENQGWLKYDPEKAKELIKESGVGKGSTIELSFGSTADVSIQRLMEIVQENLNAVGLEAVTVVYDEDSRLYLRRNGSIMAYRFEWIADYNDPDNFIYTIFGSYNSTKKYSSNYKEMVPLSEISRARTIVNDKERMEKYASLEKRLVERDAVWVPLYSGKHVFIKGERLKNYTPYWAGWSDVILKNMELVD